MGAENSGAAAEPINYNPDILNCLANLSSDEVFTPPDLANAMLDRLPQNLWSDKNARFLDPCTKSGVFLREIARRLFKGLESVIPDKQQRIDHILTQQLFGLALTELTALMSRRSLYCSKNAQSSESLSNKFSALEGNILFESGKNKHEFQNSKCIFCGAAETGYERGADFESYAYAFIHTKTPQDFFAMSSDKKNKPFFDVVIGNPPYQLKDGGHGASARPIYQEFVSQAKKLNPRYLCMIIPSRWFAGGKGLDEFRKEMMADRRIKTLHDFPKSKDCFPGVEIKGGVCYFLWDREHKGKCQYVLHDAGAAEANERYLDSGDAGIVIRHNKAISILDKIIGGGGRVSRHW